MSPAVLLKNLTLTVTYVRPSRMAGWCTFKCIGHADIEYNSI